MDVRDRMENILEFIVNITMEINFLSKVYSKSFYSKGLKDLRKKGLKRRHYSMV